ncbi:MAG TPA: enoyl-CoA hydratase-related protein [Rhodocyclaceae bacterium]|nr:enoyl-CoA hydratase-related protein [Rhodocyclaceae bacterium]
MSIVIVEKPSDGVVLLRLNRPEARNALNTELRLRLAELFAELGDDRQTRSIVVTGDMRAFAAGADLKEIVDDAPVDIMQRGVLRLWKVIADCPKPVIAAVNGVALGGGCELALHADIIIAGDNARFGQPEVRVGVMPGGGATQRLMRTIGKYRTMLLVLTGEAITGREAAAMGLASEAVADDAVVDRALEVAARIAAMPPIAVGLIKEATLAGADAALNTGLLLERRLFELLFSTRDQKEGMRAFAEKRAAHFEGR